MRRGDIYLVDLEPVRGSEANKTRPAVIVSNDAANRVSARTGRGVVTVVPITTNIDRVYPFQVRLDAANCGLAADSKAQAEQVRAVAVQRLRSRIASVPATTLRLLDAALQLHLALGSAPDVGGEGKQEAAEDAKPSEQDAEPIPHQQVKTESDR